VNTGTARHSTAAVAVLLYLCVAIGLQFASEVYNTGFGGYPDEPAHYVTGLMMRDYLLHHAGEPPMAFAEKFYVHYPVMAFGHWPPVFYVLQSAWTALLPTSRASLLVFMALWAVLAAMAVHCVVEKRLDTASAFGAGLLFLVLPITRAHAAMVMAELPLVFFSLMAVLAYAKSLEREDWRASVWFALWASVAILTKGNGWALAGVPLFTIALTRQFRLMRTVRFWGPAIIVAVLCVPFTLWTIRLVKHGWDQGEASLAFTMKAAPVLAYDMAAMMGFPVFLLAVAGCWRHVISPARRGPVSPFWASMAALIVSVFLFHATVPTSIEARKLIMAVPALLVFAAAGCRWLAGTLAERFRMNRTVPAALVIGLCAATLWQAPVLPPHVLGQVAQRVAADPALMHAAVLVSSSGTGELAFVSEMAEHEQKRFDHVVLRAGKQIATSSWLGTGYELRYRTTKELMQALVSVPVSGLVLDTVSTGSKPHHDLLRQMVREYAADWKRLDYATGPGEQVEVYALTRPVPRDRMNIQIDMTPKLNRVIGGVF
jgi:4-amino-4-deoxy-L-arabinose transferase-like glycosyltransferase